jgi:hypothetical protein
MSKVVSFRLSEKDWRALEDEAKSIPSSPGEHVKYWWLERENALQDMYDSGYNQCKRDNGIVTKK